MSQVEVERLLGRLITDADFRTRAEFSLLTTCFCEGIALSHQELSLLRTLDFSQFDHVAETLDDSVRRK